jgi:hypothetical protein
MGCGAECRATSDRLARTTWFGIASIWRPSSAFEKDEDRMHPQEMSSQLETLCKRLATLKEGL